MVSYFKVKCMRWLLEQNFRLDRPYTLIRKERVDTFFKDKGPAGWKDFYSQFPTSGGITSVSVVAFSPDETQAYVYISVT